MPQFGKTSRISAGFVPSSAAVADPPPAAEVLRPPLLERLAARDRRLHAGGGGRGGLGVDELDGGLLGEGGEGLALEVDVELLALGDLDQDRDVVQAVVLQRAVAVGQAQLADLAGEKGLLLGLDGEELELLDDADQSVQLLAGVLLVAPVLQLQLLLVGQVEVEGRGQVAMVPQADGRGLGRAVQHLRQELEVVDAQAAEVGRARVVQRDLLGGQRDRQVVVQQRQREAVPQGRHRGRGLVLVVHADVLEEELGEGRAGREGGAQRQQRQVGRPRGLGRGGAVGQIQ